MRSLYKQVVAVLIFTALSGCAAPPGYHYESGSFTQVPDDPCELSFVNKPSGLSWLNSSIGKPNGVSEKVISIMDSSGVDQNVLQDLHTPAIPTYTCHGTLVFASGNTASGIFAYSDPGGNNPLIVTWISDAELAKKKEDQRAQAVQHEQQLKLAEDARVATVKKQLKQQMKKDEAKGYHWISIADYQLDARSMPKGSKGEKLVITGFYEVAGNFQTLTQMPTFLAPSEYKILLLTDDARRSVRKKLIDLQRPTEELVPCGGDETTPPSTLPLWRVCSLTILGHVTSCTQTFMGRRVRDTVCIDVDDIRNYHEQFCVDSMRCSVGSRMEGILQPYP